MVYSDDEFKKNDENVEINEKLDDSKDSTYTPSKNEEDDEELEED